MKYSSIGKKIKYYRQERDMTQSQLAEKVGVTWEMVSRYERGASAPFEKLNGLAKALNADPLELLQDYYNASPQKKLLNNIPLFIGNIKDFSPDSTSHFYNAPLWVSERDRYSFAVDIDNDIVYVSPNTEVASKARVLIKKGEKMVIERFDNQENIIGVVIGKEERY